MTSRVLNPETASVGTVSARTLVLEAPLSFWGGYDPGTGEIIDRHHPQTGCRAGGTIMVMPRSRGSAGTPAGLAESIRRGTGPVAIILGQADVNIAIGAMTAARLYNVHVPVIVAEAPDYRAIKNNQLLTILQDGNIRSSPI